MYFAAVSICCRDQVLKCCRAELGLQVAFYHPRCKCLVIVWSTSIQGVILLVFTWISKTSAPGELGYNATEEKRKNISCDSCWYWHLIVIETVTSIMMYNEGSGFVFPYWKWHSKLQCPCDVHVIIINKPRSADSYVHVHFLMEWSMVATLLVNLVIIVILVFPVH
jgi:hypothetical protein